MVSTNGCNDIQYIYENKGLSLESDYTYKAKNGKCEASEYKHYDALSGPNGFNVVQRRNATALAAAIALEGPVSIGIEADQTAFQFYKSGILTGKCGTSIDHGVLAVGYGVDGGQKYWKVKNSWGSSWGENGYVRICRECDKNGDDGECCILCQPSYPTAGSSNITKISLNDDVEEQEYARNDNNAIQL